MSYSSWLDKTGNIKKFTRGTPDGQGGFLPGSWSIFYKNIKFQLVSLSKKQQDALFDKKQVDADYFLYIKEKSGLDESCRMYWGARIFEFKLIISWEEKGRFMKIAVTEVDRG